MLYGSQEPAMKLFNDYSLIAFEATYRAIHVKGIPSMSTSVAYSKVSDHSSLKILSPKQMFQRLSTALVKADDSSENLLNEIRF